MMTNVEIAELENPLKTAYAIQHQMAELKMRLTGLETDFRQIILYCKALGKTTVGNYDLTVKRDIRRTVDPRKFAEMFPEANEHLLQMQLALLDTEIERLTSVGILSEITIENAKRYVGEKALDAACNSKVYEKETITVNPDK